MVGGHCHLPHDDQLPTLPVGAERVRGSRSSVVLCSNAQSSTLNWPMFLQWRVEETVARFSWTKLSAVNSPRDLGLLDTELTSRQKVSSHFLQAIRRHGVGRGARPANK